MVQLSAEYYDQMSSTVTASLRRKGGQDIKLAESQRLQDPSVMDILGARELDMSIGPDEPGRPQPRATGPKWLQLALAIEEQQYVVH